MLFSTLTTTSSESDATTTATPTSWLVASAVEHPAPSAVVASAVEEEEEPEDPKPAIEAECADSAECKPVKARLESCTERVNANPDTEETCVEEFFDLMHCINHCAPDKIFHHLK